MPRELGLKLEELEELAQKYGTPLQIYDEKMIRENARQLLSAFRLHFPGIDTIINYYYPTSHQHLIDFTQFFAVKALPNPAICKILIDEGCGLDCSSTAEIHLAQQLNLPGEKVMFTSNYTSKVSYCYNNLISSTNSIVGRFKTRRRCSSDRELR